MRHNVLRNNSKIISFIIITLTLMILISCGGGGGGGGTSSPGSGSTQVRIMVGANEQAAGPNLPKMAFAAIPANVATISFTISAADMTTYRQVIPVAGQTSITETFTIPNGSNRFFLVEAKNAAGAVLYSGSTTADLNGGTVTLNIIMTELTAPQSISGTITSWGTALAGVTVTLTGTGSTSTTTDANGVYTFANAANGSYTLAPSLTGYSFSPTSASVNVSGANGTVQNFTATSNAANAVEAAQYVSQALAYFTNNDVANASIAYEKALIADPANKDANFGGALTRIVMLIDDPNVRDILTKWEAVIEPSANQILTNASPIGNPFTRWSDAVSNVNVSGGPVILAATAPSSPDAVQAVAAAYLKLKAILPKAAPQGALAKYGARILATIIPATAPTVSEMQTLISGTILPALNQSLARLKKVEGGDYTFTMTKAMQGNPVSGVDIIMNDGEVYALETAINAFICMLNVAVSYDLDVYDADGNGTRNDYDKMQQDPLKTFNQSTFFTLKATGAASMQAGLTALRNGIATLDKAYAVVKTRTAANTAAGQGAFDLTNMMATDRTDFEKFLSYAKKAIVGQTDILYDNDTRTVAVDIAKFFTNPLTRADLPTLGYDVQPDATLSAKYNDVVAAEYISGTALNTWTTAIYSEIVPKSDIPDYTLNGILPTNTTSNNVANFTGILPVLDGKLLTMSGGDPLPLLYGANVKASTGTNENELYFSYTSLVNNNAVYKLDTTTGIVSTYCTSVTGVPTGYTYEGLRHSPIPANIYARLSRWTATGTDYEFRPVTVANQVCSIGSTSVNTISIPDLVPTPGRSWTQEQMGNGVASVVHYYVQDAVYQYTYKLYSATDPTAVLLTFTSPPYSYGPWGWGPWPQQVIGFRKGIISVATGNSELLQYQVSSDGKSASLSGTFPGMKFHSYFTTRYGSASYPRLSSGAGGYYWLFDGLKMIKYAAKPDGGKL